MKERINWIDWGKTLAVCTVVFCHLPQSQEWFYYRYLQSVIIVIFFFLSGYLKKDRGSDKANWRKYWHGLVIPYFLYCILVYPYWLAKFYLAHGAMPGWAEAMRPVIGTLLLQHENSFCEPLNGPLWYLPAILLMHVTVDLCRKTRYQHHLLIALCIISFILYAANKYWYFAPNLTPMGVMRNLPYYYIGYVMGLKKWFGDVKLRRDFIICVVGLAVSLLCFRWHLQAFFGGHHMLHIVLFYPVNIAFLFGMLCGCKLLDKFRLSVVVNLSIGTLVVIGLHIVLVTIVNFALEHLLGIEGTICYQWYEALPVALIIVALLYPIILFDKSHLPDFIGRQSSRKAVSTEA